MNGCILALDLGTTAFKAAPVDADGWCGPVSVVRYALDYVGGRVTCDPERYVRCALRALRGAVRAARDAGRSVQAIGISSQAQTFIPLDPDGKPVAPALVWTDAGALAEADEAGGALPDFAQTSGFLRPSPLQFLPKAMRFCREGGQARWLLLLNEWIVFCLTGQRFGDATNQGMGGFYDIVRRRWNEDALALAGLSADALAPVFPAAARRAPVVGERGRAIGVPGGVPVYSCGNDQSCAAVGAGTPFANFGTALVVYALHNRPVAPATADQIAGIAPLPGAWFRLGVESEFGNVLESLARLLYPRGGVGKLLDAALAREIEPAALPRVTLPGGGRLGLDVPLDCGREAIARAALERYSARFGELLEGVSGPVRPRRLHVGGGLSRSARWRAFLEERHGVSLDPVGGEHPGLVGVAKVIEGAV